jgi:hypothetical protein
MDLFTHELRIDTVTGLAQSVRQVLSPHADARPNGSAPELIVVHGISLPPREFGGPCGQPRLGARRHRSSR